MQYDVEVLSSADEPVEQLILKLLKERENATNCAALPKSVTF